MSWILIAALVTATPTPPSQPALEPTAAPTVSPTVAPTAALQPVARLPEDLDTGTLLVSQGDCLAVKIYTHSEYTHVAAVVNRHGQTLVYDSAKGIGVRCQTLDRYLAAQSTAEISILRPQEPLSREQQQAFEAHLDSQLGRPYAIHHHLTGERCDGLHCSEYVTDALVAAHVLKARQPARVSPASLVQGVTQYELYGSVVTVQLSPAVTPLPEEAGWCRRTWQWTKTCTSASYLKVRGMLCCF